MDFSELYMKRESCRNFNGEAVPREALEKIAEAGRFAPSACNSQPWHFYIVSGDRCADMRKALQWFGTNKFTDKATAFIAVVGAKANYPERVGQAICGRDFSNIDIGIAVENMSLAARDLGFGSCILGGFYEGKVKEIIGADKKSKDRVKLVLAVGCMENAAPKNKSRKPFGDVVTFVD